MNLAEFIEGSELTSKNDERALRVRRLETG